MRLLIMYIHLIHWNKLILLHISIYEEVTMRKVRVPLALLIILVLLNTSIIAYGECDTNKRQDGKCHVLNELTKNNYSVEPMYIVYCPKSFDGKHHYLRIARNSSLKLKDSSGNVVGTWWGVPSECEYCRDQIWVDFIYSEYIHISNIYVSGITQCWAYEKDLVPVHDDSMKF